MVELTEKEKIARGMIFLPLDNMDSIEAIESRLDEQGEFVANYKVGMGSFTRFGHGAINAVHERNLRAFLDLKYHDIPNTVHDAVLASAELGVYMVNVHASGGMAMMEAARKGAEDGERLYGHRPKVIAVTVLTSLDEAKYLQTFSTVNPALAKMDFGNYATMGKDDEDLQDAFRQLLLTHRLTDMVRDQVKHLALMSAEAGLDGIVCAAADLETVNQYLPDGFLKVNPGVKGPNTEAGNDQMRVATPANAVKWGSDYPVIGRAITGGKTPEARQRAAYEVLQDMAREL